MKKILVLASLYSTSLTCAAQKDTGIISFHFQQTIIPQYHFKFYAPYSDVNSLISSEDPATSLTSTLFFALKPWKNGLLIVNPEVAGGKGVSNTTGLAGFSNGEVFRIGDPKPVVYLARLVWEQKIPLQKTNSVYVADEANTVRGVYPARYVKVFAGRFSLADYFDDNSYSHDPRSQFMNWSFMSAGAWDYAADTRGYTWGLGAERKGRQWRIAAAATLVPQKANALELDTHMGKALALQIELTYFYTTAGQTGQLQTTVFFNRANMGNYATAVKQAVGKPDITRTADYKNHKWGWVINAAQAISKHWGGFARLSWNDGHNETWAFTEIDRSVNVGLQWSKDQSGKTNVLGIGAVVNGISNAHRNYLAAGGYGFIIGDGQLNYASELISELYYRFCFFNNRFQVSPDYQFVINPAYNKDRGPVHLIALRTHVEF